MYLLGGGFLIYFVNDLNFVGVGWIIVFFGEMEVVLNGIWNVMFYELCCLILKGFGIVL